MKVVALVAAESARLRRLAAATTLAWPAALGVAVLTGGARGLADGRWLSASPLWPFAVWGIAAAASIGSLRDFPQLQSGNFMMSNLYGQLQL